MQCELCGKDTELFTAVVEGTQLRVCANCGRFGKVLRKVQPPASARPARVRHESMTVERVVGDYATRVRTAREKRGLNQQDFAKLITLKESLVHKIETGHFEPDIETARKLEKALYITLVETSEESGSLPAQKNEPSAGLTIGDILKMKR